MFQYLSPLFPNTGISNKIFKLIGKNNYVKFPNSNQFWLLEYFVGDFLVYILTHEFSCSHSSYFLPCPLWISANPIRQIHTGYQPWTCAVTQNISRLAHALIEFKCFHHSGKEAPELLQQLAVGESSNIFKGSFHK